MNTSPTDFQLGVERGLYQFYLETGETDENAVRLISYWRTKNWSALGAEIQRRTGNKVNMLQNIADAIGGEIV